jgi:hypothetical protein
MARSPRGSYQRRITPPSQFSIRVYATLTAEALWGWNRLHSALFEIFAALLENRAVAHAIWHFLQSDKNQREMLLEAAVAKLGPKSRAASKVRWLIRTVNRYAPLRNAVVHAPLVFEPMGRNKPSAIQLDDLTGREQALLRLGLAGGKERFWNSLAGDLFCLGQYAGSICDDIAPPLDGNGNPQRPPSLHRPRLLTLRRLIEIDAQISRLQSNKEPEPRRRASKAKPRS